MNKKKTIAFAVMIIPVILAALVVKNRSTFDRARQDSAFDKSSRIKLKDIETYDRGIDFREENAKIPLR